MTVRVIGLGNPLRGDDAVGLEVARRLEAAAVPGIEVRRVIADAGRILDAFEGAKALAIVDAARTGAPPGTVHRLSPTAADGARLGSGTHDAGLADALRLADALERPLARCALYLVEGADFRLGQPLSDPVEAAVTALAAEIAALAEVSV